MNDEKKSNDNLSSENKKSDNMNEEKKSNDNLSSENKKSDNMNEEKKSNDNLSIENKKLDNMNDEEKSNDNENKNSNINVIIPVVNTFNKKCPICLEKNGVMFVLEDCHHKIHLECCVGLNSLDCPICRSNVLNWPKDIRSSIEKNIVILKEERQEEERQYVMGNYVDVVNNMNMTHISYTPQLAAVTAMDYLREHDIPQRYIPENIEITFFTGNPLPHASIIFETLVNAILEKISFDICDEEIDINENIGENTNEYFSDNEEDPFSNENLILEVLERKIRVRRI